MGSNWPSLDWEARWNSYCPGQVTRCKLRFTSIMIGCWLSPDCTTRTQAMLSVFTSPSRYTQGKGATAALGREMTALGLEGPVLIIAGKTVIGLLAPAWQRSLDEAGFKHIVHRFSGECSLTEIERVKAAGRKLGAPTIVGAGGGKVLDTARAAAAGLGLPVVNCPTVASSDAPCSALSVIYTDEGVFRSGVNLGTPGNPTWA